MRSTITKDNANSYGELNTNGKLFTCELIGETLAVILGTIKSLDSSTSCQQREDFQMLCNDPDCPRCNSKVIAVSTLKGPTIAAVLVKDLIRRLPHVTLDDGVCPNAYRTNFYGNFPFATLNRRDFKDRGGNFLISIDPLVSYNCNDSIF